MKREKTEEVPIVGQTVDELPKILDTTLPPELENEVDAKITTTESNESAGASVFSEPQPSVPVEVKIEPVVREKITVDKAELYKMIYCLGTGSTYQHVKVSLVNKIGAIFGISQEDGWKLWEEIKNFQSKQ
jgi:hypothetical protein